MTTMVPLCRACGSRRCPGSGGPDVACASAVRNAVATLQAFIDTMPAHPGYGTQPHADAHDALQVLMRALVGLM